MAKLSSLTVTPYRLAMVMLQGVLFGVAPQVIEFLQSLLVVI
jgi:hypothetical protein